MQQNLNRAAWTEINLENIKFNYNNLKKIAGESEIIPMLKADGYGHGALEIARVLENDCNVKKFGVATIDEAVSLCENKIKAQIILLSSAPRNAADYIIKYNLIPVISDYAYAESINKSAEKNNIISGIFLKLETGMGRLGFMRNAVGIAEIKKILDLKNIKINGVMSHFANADASDMSFTFEQIKIFNLFCEELKKLGLDTTYRSIANSAGLIKFNEARLEAVRPGIALYGCYPSENFDKNLIELKAVMSVKTNIVLIKKVPENFCVSYGSIFKTERESLLGILPIGYADGLPRALNGRGRVYINKKYAPIVGNICMDQCIIDLTDIDGVMLYDEAEIMGMHIEAEEIGGKTGTINYEILCGFGQRLNKIYIN